VARRSPHIKLNKKETPLTGHNPWKDIKRKKIEEEKDSDVMDRVPATGITVVSMEEVEREEEKNDR
jgi:hypothetical protein